MRLPPIYGIETPYELWSSSAIIHRTSARGVGETCDLKARLEGLDGMLPALGADLYIHSTADNLARSGVHLAKKNGEG